MTTIIRITALALFASAMSFAAADTADAQIRLSFGNGGIQVGGGGSSAYYGGGGHHHQQQCPASLPRLGFWSHVDHGEGLHVTGVRYGSPAWQLGIREGDTIQALNEFSLAHGGWNNALRDAMYHHDGFVELCIRKPWGQEVHVTYHFHEYGHGHVEYSYSSGS